MKKLASLALLGLSLAAAPLQAQGPGPMGGGRAGAPAVSMLLAHTGELELSDAQVVRLAAIARRAHERREALRAGMPRPPAPGAQRQAPSEAEAQRMRQQREQAREQSRADLRDALAVLTPDQQARAWELSARGGGRPGELRGARGRGRGGPGGMRERGPGRPGGPAQGRRPGAPPPAPNGAQAPGQQ